ncbi:hypothetical protein LTS18_007430, partial [Coniosporium uncinatum]
MIGTSTGEYVFIRACVTFLHYIAPFSVFYSLSLLASQLLHQDIPRFPFFIEIWLAVEAVFFIFVFHPHKVYLQRAAVHPAPPPRTERKKLFELCKRNVSDPEAYIRGWFKGAPLEDVGRDGVKLFLAWGFLNKGTVDAENEEELQEYLREMEEIIGPDFRFGNGKAQPLRLTFDPIDLLHRSLWWYLCVFVVDSITSSGLLWRELRYYGLSFPQSLAIVPWRAIDLLPSKRVSPARHLTYWYRPHTSKTRHPVLFIHGIGIGLWPYSDFFAELTAAFNVLPDEDGGQVGIL